MRTLRCLVVAAALVIGPPGRATMAPPCGDQGLKAVEGTPVLWRDPGAIAERDLFWGRGHVDRVPKPPFVLLDEPSGGSNPKVVVRDATGTEWSVKFAGPDPHKNEVHAEVAATRLAWALGYLVEENYFVAGGTIEGVGTLKRAASSVAPDGTFGPARFERKDPAMQSTEHTWSFEANPFLGSRELSGVKVLSALLNHWDVKHDNTAIVQVRRPDGRPGEVIEAWYLFADFGSTFGKMGGLAHLFSGRDRWNLEEYRRAPLVTRVRDGRVHLNYQGIASIDPVPVEHARWFAELASQLTPRQVRRAFEASGAATPEIDGFSARVLEKIQELRAAVR